MLPRAPPVTPFTKPAAVSAIPSTIPIAVPAAPSTIFPPALITPPIRPGKTPIMFNLEISSAEAFSGT